MRDRLRRIEKILKIQTMTKKLAETRIAMLTQKDLQLQDRQRALIEALDAQQPCHGLFTDVTAKRIASLNVERCGLAQETSEQKRIRDKAAMRESVAEKKAALLEFTIRDAQERQMLEETKARLRALEMRA